jgi:UDP-N-acetylmuramoyl-tripeptide--D-alanyl-D-alanine ligase
MLTTTEERMALFTIGEVGEILGSKMEGGLGFHRASIYGVSTDSRTVKPSELFIAIKGDTFNGHDFLETAFANGAIAAVVNRYEISRRKLSDSRYIGVDDTLFALGELALHYRKRMPAKVVAVTGSNGKTTVKNLIYEILCQKGPALKSQGNFNNLVGLPTSIFRLRREHKSAVFELGMSARGEIARLSEISSPDIAVITNVGLVHLEFLNNIEEVAEAKLELLEHIKPNGILIVNGDDVTLNSKLGKITRKMIRFGLHEDNDISPKELRFDELQLAHFKLGGQNVDLKFPGIHNVYNALAAFAVSKAVGVSAPRAIEAINAFQPGGLRSEIFRKEGMTLIIDCYNANPTSTVMALDTLSKMTCRGARIAVLADMLELGDKSQRYHEEIGDYARNIGIDNIFAYGPMSRYIVSRFGDGGFHFENKQELIESLKDFISNGDLVLFKGSRGMALEEVVDAIKKIL